MSLTNDVRIVATEPSMTSFPRVAHLPEFFVHFDEPGPHQSALRGERVSNDLSWQIRDSAISLVDEPLRFLCRYQHIEDVPDVMLHNDLLVVSNAARELVSPLLKDAEFFHVAVELNASADPGTAGGGRTIEGYWWLNCWRRLDLVDWQRSEMSLYSTPRPPLFPANSPVRATRWQSLILRRPVPDDEHLFGIAGVQGERRYISSELHRRVLESPLRATFNARFFSPPSDALAVRNLKRALNTKPTVGG